MLDAPEEFLPMAAGMAAAFKAQNDLVNNLLGRVCYTVLDGYVNFTEDITATKNIRFVEMHLVVMDLGKYSNYDLLPLPADMAAKVVEQCYKILSGQQIPDKRVDSVAEENKQR